MATSAACGVPCPHKIYFLPPPGLSKAVATDPIFRTAMVWSET
jgi:hypothetical protein